jgi:hypothetical protein
MPVLVVGSVTLGGLTVNLSCGIGEATGIAVNKAVTTACTASRSTSAQFLSVIVCMAQRRWTPPFTRC